MADYCTRTQVKDYIKTDKTGDDSLIDDLITRASQRIDSYCQRKFTAYADTREFDAVADIDGRILYLDEDLISVTSITNGDGTTIDAADYVLLPANYTPKYAIKLKASAGASWTYSTDPESAIAVNGTWGWQNGTVAPEDIIHAAVRMTAWMYHQTQAPFETIGLPELGQVVIPADMPADIKALLDPYRRGRIV